MEKQSFKNADISLGVNVRSGIHAGLNQMRCVKCYYDNRNRWNSLNYNEKRKRMDDLCALACAIDAVPW